MDFILEEGECWLNFLLNIDYDNNGSTFIINNDISVDGWMDLDPNCLTLWYT